MEKASRSVADLLAPALLFVAAFALQSRSIGRVVIQALSFRKARSLFSPMNRSMRSTPGVG